MCRSTDEGAGGVRQRVLDVVADHGDSRRSGRQRGDHVVHLENTE